MKYSSGLRFSLVSFSLLWSFVFLNVSFLRAQTPTVRNLTHNVGNCSSGTDRFQPSGNLDFAGQAWTNWNWTMRNFKQRVLVTNQTGVSKTYTCVVVTEPVSKVAWFRGSAYDLPKTVAHNATASWNTQSIAESPYTGRLGIIADVNTGGLAATLVVTPPASAQMSFEIRESGRLVGRLDLNHQFVSVVGTNISGPSSEDWTLVDTGQSIQEATEVEKPFVLTFNNQTDSTKSVNVVIDPNVDGLTGLPLEVLGTYSVPVAASSQSGTYSTWSNTSGIIRVNPVSETGRTTLVETGTDPKNTTTYNLSLEWLPPIGDPETKTIRINLTASLTEPATVFIKDIYGNTLTTMTLNPGTYSNSFDATIDTTVGGGLVPSTSTGGVTITGIASTQSSLTFTISAGSPPPSSGPTVVGTTSDVQTTSTNPDTGSTTGSQVNQYTTTAVTNPTTGMTDYQTTSNGSLVPGSGYSIGTAGASDPEAFLKLLDGKASAMAAASKLPTDNGAYALDLTSLNSTVDNLQGPNGGFFLPSMPATPSIGMVSSFTIPMVPGKIPDLVIDLTRPEIHWFRDLALFVFTLLYIYGCYKVSEV